MNYRVGRGLSDITGEPADCGMLGYGKAEQRTSGIHLRQRCRAFVIDDGTHRVLLVVAEIPLPMQNVTDEVHRRLAQRFGSAYTEQNTLITVTHTHAGPGGYCGHTLYNMTTNGFRPKTFDAIVDGIVEAVEYAHDDLSDAQLTLTHGELHGANVNRSRASFDRNPPGDRAFFPDAVDPQTTLLSIERHGRPVGAVNFFATHGTSMTNRNTLISSDNKGYAAYHWERLDHGADYLSDTQPAFISAFAQTNAGDMSPNLDVGKGPTDDEFENTRLIGLRQYEAARNLLSGNRTPVHGTVDARLTYVDLGSVLVRPEFSPDGQAHRTSRPVFAAAQLAGTDEGEGFPGFHQGRNNPVWEGISRIFYRRNPELRDAQEPKAMFAPASATNRFTDFVQEQVPVQLLRIGQLYLLGIPGEVTIVAGLRLRRTIAAIVGAALDDVLVVGYSNAYIHYVTTPEEYLEQRYEGGSTLFGRWELPALQQVAADLAAAMSDGRPMPLGPRPIMRPPRSWARGVRPEGSSDIGTVQKDSRSQYSVGETVRVEFVSGHPNTNLRRGGTYLEVQRLDGDHWVRIADDGDWSTVFRWRRDGRRGSVATVEWRIPSDADGGQYRMVHHGTARRPGGRMDEFTGTSSPFTVN